MLNISKLVFNRITNHQIQIQSIKYKCTDEINKKFKICIPHSSDYDKVVKFMKKTYFKTEPCLVSCGLSLKEPSPLLIDIMKKQLEQGLSLIAVGENNEIISAAINCESNSSTELDYYPNLSKLADDKIVKDFLDFEGYLFNLSNICENYNVDKYFTISMGAVDQRYQKFGVAQEMIEHSVLLAKKRGYKLVIADISSKYTGKIMKKLGFTAVVTVLLKDYLNDQGELLFNNIIQPHDSTEIFVHRI